MLLEESVSEFFGKIEKRVKINPDMSDL